MDTFEKYQAEAQERWGQTAAYKEYAEKTKGDSNQKRQDQASEMDNIMAAFAACAKNNAPDSAPAQDLVKKLQNHITERYYHCTKAILAGLGQMYVADERFKNNIDRHGDGTAAFVCEAIIAYCTNEC